MAKKRRQNWFRVKGVSLALVGLLAQVGVACGSAQHKRDSPPPQPPPQPPADRDAPDLVPEATPVKTAPAPDEYQDPPPQPPEGVDHLQ